ERLGGLGALTLDVLAEVGPRDGIEDIGDLLLVFSIERDRDDTGLLSLLADAQIGLQVVDHTRPAALLDAELGARACLYVRDEDLDAIMALAGGSGLSHFTGHEHVSLGPFERKSIAVG